MSILIQNGHVLDPATGRDGVCDVLIENERIACAFPGPGTGI